MSQLAKLVTRAELYEAVWSKTIGALAREWNTTYTRLVRACEEMEVSRPRQGHWQVIAHGLLIEREPLPEPTGKIPKQAVLLPPGTRQQKTVIASGVTRLAKEEPKKADAPTTAERQEAVERPAETAAEARRDLESELPKVAERAVLDMIRQATEIEFWQEKVSECVRPARLEGWLHLDEQVKVSMGRLESVVRNVRKDYQSFQVEVKETRDRYNPSERQLEIEIQIREGFEWKDVWEEAWSFAEHPNPHCLSDNALRLHQWAKGPKNSGKLTDRRRVGAQARLRGTYSNMGDHLREIRQKADPNIQWEEKWNASQGQMRVWFEETERIFYHHGPLNPALGLNAREYGHQELERFRKWLYEEILKPGFPEGDEVVGIFDIRDRKTLRTVFSELPDECGSYGPLPDLFDGLRVMDGLEVRHRFKEGEPWLVVCQLQSGTTWKEIKGRLAAKASETPLEKRYSLSPDSRALLQWIMDLRSDEFLLGMTPPVEEHLEDDIGIKMELGKENVGTYVQLLLEEINERTEFKLRTVPWHHCGKDLTRVLVKKKQVDLEGAVHAVQSLGLSKGRLLDGDMVRAMIRRLVGEGLDGRQP